MLGTTGGIKSIAEARAAFCAVNPHCLERIIGLTQDTEVSVAIDIIDDGGSKLVDRGATLSSSLALKLQQRRLQTPLEASLDLAQGVSLATIVDDCLGLISEIPALALLGGARSAERQLRAVGRMPLQGPLKLLLTLARRRSKESYENSLAAMIVCSGLAHGVGLSENDSELLILSALLQDIGEAYLNPQLVDGGDPLPVQQWPNVVVHPRVAQAFLTAFTNFPAALGDCVVQHHERQDGGGYPFQRNAATMTPLGALIGLADCVSAVIMGGGTARAPAIEADFRSSLGERVAIALNIVPGEFPSTAVAFVSTALAPLKERSAGIAGGSFAQRILPTLQQIRSARLAAEALSRGATTPGLARTGELAESAIRRLDKPLRTTGVYDISQLGILEGDPERMGKICLILDEVKWRLRHLARCVYLRSGQSEAADELAQVADLVAVLDAS
jgi:hypothetical protein